MRHEMHTLVKEMRSRNISYAEATNFFRRQFVLEVLHRHNWNLSRVAKAMGLHRNTMTRWLRELRIHSEDKAALRQQRLDRKVVLASEKRPVFLKENGDPRSLPRRAPLSRLAAGHRESGAERP